MEIKKKNLRYRGWKPFGVKASQIIEAINLANDLRTRLGVQKIEDLPLGRRGNARCCILAKAFNFNCAVNPLEDLWIIEFHQATVEQWKTICHWANDNGLRVNSHIWSRRVYLPPRLARIAIDFDNGNLNEYNIESVNDYKISDKKE